MNKSFSLSALTLALVTAAGSVAAADLGDISVYGKINATLSSEKGKFSDTGISSDSSRWAMRSNASRFGVKGSSKLDDADLQAIYQLEWAIDTVNDGEGSSNHINSRNQFVGLKSGAAGEIRLGRFDTPLKESQGKVDQFNDLYGDLANTLVGDNRADHIFAYSSPKIANALTLNLAFVPGQEWDYSNFKDNGKTVSAMTGNKEIENHIADGFSGSAVYEVENLYVAAAFDKDIVSKLGADALTPSLVGLTPTDFTLTPNLINAYRLTAQATVSDFTFGGMLQTAKSSGDDADNVINSWKMKQDGFLLSGAYKFGNETLKLQYTHSKEKDTWKGEQVETDKINSLSLGIDHKLAKKTKVFAFYTKYDSKVAPKDDSTAKLKADYLGFGLDHSF